MRILVTGAAGQVGSTVARGLRKRHQVRGHDRVPMPELDDTIVSDLNDFDAVLEATRGMDGVAHIGGLPGDDEWEPIHQSNIVGTYNVFEACRRNGVKRVAFASRVGVLGQYPRPSGSTRLARFSANRSPIRMLVSTTWVVSASASVALICPETSLNTLST